MHPKQSHSTLAFIMSVSQFMMSFHKILLAPGCGIPAPLTFHLLFSSWSSPLESSLYFCLLICGSDTIAQIVILFICVWTGRTLSNCQQSGTDCHTCFLLAVSAPNQWYLHFLYMPCWTFENKGHLVVLRGCNPSTTCHPAWLVSWFPHLQERCHCICCRQERGLCICYSHRLFRLGIPTILPPWLNLTKLPFHPDSHSRIPPPLKSPFNWCLSLGPCGHGSSPPTHTLPPISVLSDSQGLQHLETKFPRNPASVPA